MELPQIHGSSVQEYVKWVSDRIKVFHCFQTGLTGSDLDNVLDVIDKDFAVSDVSGVNFLRLTSKVYINYGGTGQI